ncbi:unnamed protein product [Prorocentrum cordatum]|uniref:Uncharacterized protein n=1 Tax=Prorocentrum cordatum TaxID=2364126 RepID=A0ABN9XTT6_9DINO|nr:unnamed protein product [Polarella glacialis]
MCENKFAPAVHTPAHRKLEVIDELALPERRIGNANWRADLEAKKAIELHARPSEAEVFQVDVTIDQMRKCARLMASVLPLFPRAFHQRPPRRGRPTKVFDKDRAAAMSAAELASRDGRREAKRPVADPQGPVLELLRSHGVRSPAAFYDQRVRGKLLRFDNVGSKAPASARGSQLGALDPGCGKSWKEPAGREQWRHLRHHAFEPLRKLWEEYARDLCPGGGEALALALAGADLHGSTLQVVQSKSPGCVGLRGTVVEETQGTFRIITAASQVRVLPKQQCVFEVAVRGQAVRLLGPAWAHRLPSGVPGPRAPGRWALP